LPLRVGIVGTGYAAKLRAEALQTDARVLLTAVAGHTPETTQNFSQTFGIEGFPSWKEMFERSPLDLVIICTVNRDHGAIARFALETGKHAIVEYPLALDLADAASLIQLARTQQLLLHVEHIELLGGMHQALKRHLDQIGTPFYARYATVNPQHPAPHKWTYHPDLFGFPLMGALSRILRLTNLFGSVATVSCQTRFWQAMDAAIPSPYYGACLCTAHLRFSSGLLAAVTYGKGETLWQPERRLEVHGNQGAILFDGDTGILVTDEGKTSIDVGTRRGLFARDTAIALDHLIDGKPLYLLPENSLYALKVADAARQSSRRGGGLVEIEPP